MTTGHQSTPGPDYRRLFEAVPSALYVLDTDFVYTAVSDAYLAVINIERDQLLGKTPFEVLAPPPTEWASASLHRLRLSLEKVLATGRPDTVAISRWLNFTDDGTRSEERFWSSASVPVLDAHGRVVYIIRRGDDVTEFVRQAQDTEEARAVGRERPRWELVDSMEAQLIARGKEVQAVNQQLLVANEELAGQQVVKDRFIATLSHELRNPLAAITAAIELLELDLPSGHPALAVLERQSDALVRMTGDLLDSSRAQTGRLTLTRERLDLQGVIDSVTEDMMPAYRDAGLALRATPPSQPVAVDGDRVRLAQMLTNLLRNSCQHSHPGDEVAVALTEEDGRAVVSVCDAGEGFDPAESESLFEMFGGPMPPKTTSADGVARRSTRGSGLGLGLGLVRAIAELHGGSVSAHSAGPGNGAQFRIQLPLAGSDGRPVNQPALPGQQGAAGTAGSVAQTGTGGRAHPPRRVLIIEDNTDLARIYQTLLARRGDSVQIVANGHDGLAVASTDDFDLIICDIALPDMDGCEVARQLRQLPRAADLPLIAVSGFSQPSDRLRSLRAGFDAHLAKPLRLEDLDGAIAKVPAKP